MILVVALPLTVIVLALFAIGWAATRLTERLDRHPAACPWCAAGRPTARQMAALPSDCTCPSPCPDIACGARPVTREGDHA